MKHLLPPRPTLRCVKTGPRGVGTEATAPVRLPPETAKYLRCQRRFPLAVKTGAATERLCPQRSQPTLDLLEAQEPAGGSEPNDYSRMVIGIFEDGAGDEGEFRSGLDQILASIEVLLRQHA